VCACVKGLYGMNGMASWQWYGGSQYGVWEREAKLARLCLLDMFGRGAHARAGPIIQRVGELAVRTHDECYGDTEDYRTDNNAEHDESRRCGSG